MPVPLFTPEELAELAAFDAEVDEKELTAQDYRESAQRDKEAVMAEKGLEQRKKAKQIAAYRRERYEANKDQIAAYQREYYEANKDQIAAKKREYNRKTRSTPEGRAKYNQYMREYRRRKQLEKKGESV